MKICGSRCSLADPRPRQVSKEKKAAGAKNAAAMKKAGKGIFAPKTLSPALAAICGKKVMPRTEVTKQIWVYIKKKVRRFFSPMPVQNGVHVELTLRRFDPNNALHKRETSSANGFRSVLTRRA